MLDDFKETQFVAYSIMVNAIKNNMVSHAYLIDENNNDKSFNMVMAFVKAILCKDNKTCFDDDCNCSLCRRIDDGNYPEVKIISADGMYIKKQQVIDLQREFSLASVEGKYRIYIIRDCDKMRAETANSILKFLEEPDNSLIAILMTNNYNNVLPTIISRCQVIRLNGQVSSLEADSLSEIAFSLISSFECVGIRTVLDVKKLWNDRVMPKDRDKVIMIFDKLIDMYYDVLMIKEGIKKIKFVDYYDSFVEFSEVNDVFGLLHKISYLTDAKDSIKFNVNVNLLILDLIVNVGGYNDSRN